MSIGDLIYCVGLLGLVIYACFLVIRQTGRASKLSEAIRQYERHILALQQRLAELETARTENSPGVDTLLERVIALREQRDKLQMSLEDMQARMHDRDVHIKMSSHGD